VGETFFWGKRSVTDKDRLGWPATSRTEENIVKVRQIVCENRQVTVRGIAEQVNIDRETVRKILTKILTWGRGVQKWSQTSSPKNKSKKVTICQDLLERQDDILGHVITGDETWVYQYDPEKKRQSAQWKTANSSRPKKLCQSKSRVTTMLLTFFLY